MSDYDTLSFILRQKHLRTLLQGSLSNNDGGENVPEKVNSRFFKIHHSYSVSFNLLMLVNFSGVEFLETVAKFKKKKTKIVFLCLHPPQNVKLGTFMSCSYQNGKEMCKKA